MQKELIEFLIRAKRNTYAGKGAETTSSRPNSHDLIYEENELKYIDTYLGGRCFTGEEAIWKDNKPLWAMNYSGRVIGANFSCDFLKDALYHAPENKPFRGPDYYEDGEYTYTCSVNGDPDWYQGYEEIKYQGQKIYECYYHGGIVE
ncbi:MAG TPA: hypothetical protein GX731_10590 [Clostridiales bacterium]|nr:hypothetical protein [Clostridiales bacterium]